MKTRYILSAILIGLSLSSCMKKFDETSYAPPLNIGGYTSSSEIAKANLVAYWAFDGSLIDSVSKTSGTATATTFAGGVKGQALQGALNAYAATDTPEPVQGLKSFSVSLWENNPFNANGIVGLIDIANTSSFWGNLTIFFENGGSATSGNLKIHVNNNGVDAWLGNYVLTSPWSKWNQIAVTYNDTISTFNVYVNGGKIATQQVANYGPVVFQNASKMVFGTVQFQTEPSLTSATGKQDWASYLTGQLDEVRIYNKALSDSEIGSLSKLEGRGK